MSSDDELFADFDNWWASADEDACPDSSRGTALLAWKAAIAVVRAHDSAELAALRENVQRIEIERGKVIDEKVAELAALRAERDRMETALERIDQWSQAYPLDIFPEPDHKRAAAILSEHGMTIDSISASAMRHVVTGVGEIARAALGER